MGVVAKQRHVRVSEATHRTLRELADQTGEPMTALLDRAVERLRREQIFAQAAAEWRALQSDPAVMAELEAEYALWDTTVADGLEREDERDEW